MERPVKIEKLFVFPIKGVRSPDSVREMLISQNGIKYDRQLCVIDAATGRGVNHRSDKLMASLSQYLNGS
jgi:uncharacterized protein YcbX